MEEGQTYPEVRFFGVRYSSRGDVGHHLCSPKGATRDDLVEYQRLKRVCGKGLDGSFCPEEATEGICRIHHIDTFTILAFVDRSGDSRPGSNTAIIVYQKDATPEFCLACFYQFFPQEFQRAKARFKFINEETGEEILAA